MTHLKIFQYLRTSVVGTWWIGSALLFFSSLVLLFTFKEELYLGLPNPCPRRASAEPLSITRLFHETSPISILANAVARALLQYKLNFPCDRYYRFFHCS
jgi:hypothetical protein